MSLDAMTEPHGTRAKFIDVDPRLILELLKVGLDGTRIDDRIIRFDSDPIPVTAKALRAGITPEGLIRIVIEDESFPLSPDGYQLMRLCPKYSATDVSVDTIADASHASHHHSL